MVSCRERIEAEYEAIGQVLSSLPSGIVPFIRIGACGSSGYYSQFL